jgi:hypothetical protein
MIHQNKMTSSKSVKEKSFYHCVLFFFGVALAFINITPAAANPFEKEPVNSTFDVQGDKYHFDGDFTINADRGIIWEVLTDYGHVQDFVADFHGKILRREGNVVWLEQSIGEGFLFIRFDVHAQSQVHEQPYVSIFSEDIGHKEFTCFQETWHLYYDPSGTGTKVTCTIDIQRNQHTPWYITPDVLRKGLPNYLKQFRYEIERREAKAKKDFAVIPARAEE